MGKLPLSVTVSAAVHLVAVGWVATRDIEIDHVEAVPPALTTIELVDTATPLEVSTATSSGGEAASIASTQDTARRSISRSTTGSTSGGSGEPIATPDKPDKPPGERSPTLTMRRGGDRADLTLPGTRDDLDRVPAGTTPRAPASSGQLAPDGTGHTSDQGPYVAKVDKDGGVTFKDRPDVSIRIAIPTPKIIGRGIAEWYESDKGEDGQRGKRTLENEVSGTIDQATTGCGGVRDNACSPDRTRTVIIPVFRGGVNPTDWLMRRTVGDPYASKKRAYLDATRDERAEIGAKHRTKQLQQTSMIMRTNLERAWNSTTDVATRKQLLFELWDEIVEPADEESALAEASRAARAQVIGFIRARLPQRGANAYRADEIAALNRKKQSKLTFAPYE